MRLGNFVIASSTATAVDICMWNDILCLYFSLPWHPTHMYLGNLTTVVREKVYFTSSHLSWKIDWLKNRSVYNHGTCAKKFMNPIICAAVFCCSLLVHLCHHSLNVSLSISIKKAIIMESIGSFDFLWNMKPFYINLLTI